MTIQTWQVASGEVTSDCGCNEECYCGEEQYQHFIDATEAFFDSSDYFFHRKGETCEYTRFDKGARDLLESLLWRTSQYRLVWELTETALKIRLHALYVEIKPCTLTCCAVCGAEYADAETQSELAYEHPRIYKEAEYRNGVPFCKECVHFYDDKYVLYVNAYATNEGYVYSSNARDENYVPKVVAVNYTREEYIAEGNDDADLYITSNYLFRPDGHAPSPDYTLWSIGKIATICTPYWHAVRISIN